MWPFKKKPAQPSPADPLETLLAKVDDDDAIAKLAALVAEPLRREGSKAQKDAEFLARVERVTAAPSPRVADVLIELLAIHRLWSFTAQVVELAIARGAAPKLFAALERGAITGDERERVVPALIRISVARGDKALLLDVVKVLGKTENESDALEGVEPLAEAGQLLSTTAESDLLPILQKTNSYHAVYILCRALGENGTRAALAVLEQVPKIKSSRSYATTKELTSMAAKRIEERHPA